MSKTVTKTAVTTKTKVALIAGGIILAAGLVSVGAINQQRAMLRQNSAVFPYQTQGYVPGYVPGYIPGNTPGYGVPGYVPGYGTFVPLGSGRLAPTQTKNSVLKQRIQRLRKLYRRN